MSSSPDSPGSDLVIDDEDLDSMEVTMEDLSVADALCSVGGHGQVLARPALAPPSTFKFGTRSTVSTSPAPVASKSGISSADPRTKFKPDSGFLSLDLKGSTNTNNYTFDSNFKLKRTVQNNAGSSSFFQPSLSQEQARPAGQQKKFIFGSSSPLGGITPQPDPSRLAGHSPPPTTTGHADICDEDLTKYVLMKEQHESKMREEEKKMKQIEKLIEQKKLRQLQQQQQQKSNDEFDPELMARKREVAKQELELKRQTMTVVQMQQDMMMKKNTDEERRRLEDRKQMLELQLQVQNLEMLLTAKKAEGTPPGGRVSTRPVRDRLGVKPEYPDRRGGGEDSEDWREARKRRLGLSDWKSKPFKTEGGVNKKGKKKYKNFKLPDDLVLTELTDHGPIKKEDWVEEDGGSSVDFVQDVDEEDDLDRYEVDQGEMDPDLVLTEFGESGPIKASPVDFSSSSTSGK